MPRVIVRPLQEFLETSTAAASVLLGAIVLALVWANSPWGASYESLWNTAISVRMGSIGIAGDLGFWIEDGLMTFFFVLVGLEIKREFATRRAPPSTCRRVAGDRGSRGNGRASLAVSGDRERRRDLRQGWGIPMATDIALALGVLALAARPSRAACGRSS